MRAPVLKNNVDGPETLIEKGPNLIQNSDMVVVEFLAFAEQGPCIFPSQSTNDSYSLPQNGYPTHTHTYVHKLR